MEELIEFKDYIYKYSNIEKEQWVTIFKQEKNSKDNIENDLYTFSVLTDNNENNINKILENDSWGFSIDNFGKSYFGKRYAKGKESIYFHSGENDDDSLFEYLIACRTFNGKYESTIEINPKLIWYRNLVEYNDEFIDPELDEVIIRKNKNFIEVQKSYLKDFLSAYNKCCVICFDHRRFFSIDSKLAYENKNISNNDMILSYVKNSYNYNEKNGFSSILGKIILRPFINPIHKEYLEYTQEKQYENFIIDQDKNTGETIEFTCDEEKLSNYFGANPNAPHFLTPIFFNKRVLNYYISDTRNYSIKDSLIIYLDKWSLPYTINEVDKVVVWLGDLGRIPFEEQKKWKVYNELPNGKIEKNFYKRQILNEWTESSIGEKGLFNRIEKLSHLFEKKYGYKLFIELSNADKEIEDALLIPASNSIPVYQNFLIQLSKVTVERINKKEITKNLSKEKIYDINEKEYGSRILLRNYLDTLNIKSAEKLDNILKLIYNSRNKLSGHSGSVKEYNKVWKREVNYNPNYISDAKNLIVSLNSALNELIEELAYENL